MKKKKLLSNEKEVKIAVTMLLVLLLLILTGARSFASADQSPEETGGTDISVQEDAADQDEDAEPADGSKESTDIEKDEEETDPGAEATGSEEEDKAAEETPEKPGTKDLEAKGEARKTVKERAQLQERAVPRAAAGERITYTGTKVGSAAGETTVFRVTSGGTTYTGTCAKQGVAMSTSGQATITRIANSKKIAKLIYHYAIEPGDANWWNGSHSTDKVGLLLGYSSDNATNVTKQRLIEAFCQIYNMGDSVWYNTITSPNTGGWSADTAQRVKNLYNNIDTSSFTVPEGFEIWYADAGNSQPFMIWAYNPTGYVTMVKKSGNESITG